MLTIRDLQSQEQFAVPPEGAVLGREGGGADIVVRDKSVSKRHAKVYERGGKWFLEDLQSANGTYVDEQPVTRPVSMKPGMSFSLSNYHFEVMPESSSAPSRPGRSAQPAPSEWDADGGYPDETAPPPEDEWAPESSAKGNRSGPGGKKAPPPKSNGAGKSQPAKSGGKSNARGGGAGTSSDAAGGVIAQIPKAVAHYMKAVPLLLLNPIGFIRGSIDDMKFPAMKPMELLPWGLVAALFQTGLGIGAGAISTITSMIQTKQFAVGSIIALFVGSAVGLAIAVVIAIVSAFIFHPLMGFIIKLLKGESDETNRSNYFVCVMTANVLVGLNAAGVGIASVFALIPVVGKFGAVLPLLGSIIGTFYLLLVAFFWFKYFQVMKWVPILIIIAAVASAASGLLGVVNVIRAGGGVGGTATLTAEQQAAIDAANALANGIPTSADGSNTPGGTSATPRATDGASSSTTTPAPTGTAVAVATPPRPGSLATARPGATPAAATGVSVAPISSGLTPYQRWAAKRDAVEKAIADDPTILKRDRDLFAGYQQYHRAVYNVKQKYAKQSKDPSQAPVVQRMIDADTFEQTGALVDQLYARVSR